MKEHKYNGETFLLDDSEGCYIKITLAEEPNIFGYVGVNLRSGSKSRPYIWDGRPNGTGNLTPDGLTGWGWGAEVESIDAALNGVCSFLLGRRGESEWNVAAKEDACKSLHEYVEKL